jgi:transglutaminase/protease-like cytokinesis protein 3
MKLHSPIANTTLLKLALFIFLFASYTSIFAQNKCKTKVSYFASRNPEKLALKLTSHLNDDAEKVEAIHCWITHHIKYDVKKIGNYDYSRISTETILKKRKAICMGYTDLFNELCKHAGIISTEVPGYTKGLHTDLNDHFYIDEHIWNAVYINNEWKYIDNTWDAGYVINHKRSIWGAFVYFFSGGKYDRFKIKPRFKFIHHKNRKNDNRMMNKSDLLY